MRIFKGGNISVTINRETTSPSDLDVVEEIERKVEWIRRFSRVGKVSPGKYNLIMSPVVAGNLFNYLGRLLSAYNILLHNSPFVNKLGERVLDKKLYLYDNPLEAGNPGAASFDMEGIPTKDLSLIEAGVVKNYLHNLLTAKKFEVESTGHAGFVSPEPHSLIVKPSSKMGLEDLLGDVGDGILLSNVWYTRFQNYAVGDFSTLQRDAAFVVKGGEISGVVGGVRVSDNIVRMFSNIVGMTGDAEWVRWWDYRTPAKMPYISVSDVNLTTGL
jgi:PmbA protein